MKTVPYLTFCLLGACLCSHASLLFDLDSPIQTTAAGGSVIFTGTLSNDAASDVFLNGVFDFLPYSELTIDFTDFFALVPPSIPDGGSYSGPIFVIDVASDAALGDYFGSFTIQGGSDELAADDLATEGFQVTVSPEPSPWLLLLTLLSAGFAAPRSYHTRANTDGVALTK